MSSIQTPDFDAVKELLTAADASWDAAEAHGAFCGRACLTGASSIPLWVNELLAARNPADALAVERARTLERCAAGTLLSLEAGDLRFHPLLPADDQPLSLRAASLADWCHGFMQGLVAAGGADEGPRADALDNETISEILADFSQITKAGVTGENNEEAEGAYTELVEFIRVSAQLVYDETAALRAQSGGNA